MEEQGKTLSCYMLDQASTECGHGGCLDQVEAGGRGSERIHSSQAKGDSS